MDEKPRDIECIHHNLYDLVDTLCSIGIFVGALSDISHNFMGDGKSVDLDVIFAEIRDRIVSVSEVLEENVKGLMMKPIE